MTTGKGSGGRMGFVSADGSRTWEVEAPGESPRWMSLTSRGDYCDCPRGELTLGKFKEASAAGYDVG